MATESNQPEIYETYAAKTRWFVERMDRVQQKVPHLSDAWRELSSITDWAKAELISLYYWHDFYKEKCEARPPETLTAEELESALACVDNAVHIGAYQVHGIDTRELRKKIDRMMSASRESEKSKLFEQINAELFQRHVSALCEVQDILWERAVASRFEFLPGRSPTLVAGVLRFRYYADSDEFCVLSPGVMMKLSSSATEICVAALEGEKENRAARAATSCEEAAGQAL